MENEDTQSLIAAEIHEALMAERFSPELIAEAVTAALDRRRRVDETTHQRHHEVLQCWLDKEAERRARLGRIKESVLGWVLISLIGGAGMLAWKFLSKPWVEQ